MKRFPGFCAVVMLVVCTSAVAGYVQITPSDDSYILTSSPTVNYGAKTTLVVQGPGATTFVRFDLSRSAFWPDQQQLVRGHAEGLRQRRDLCRNLRRRSCHRAWTEKTITAKTEPTVGTSIASAVSVTTADKNQYLLVDITAAVGEWLMGRPTTLLHWHRTGRFRSA